MEEEARKQLASDIIAIMEAYGISDFNINDKLNRSVKTLASNKIATLLRINYRHIQNVGKTSLAQYLEELPLLIQFLRACEGSVIQLKGTITNPRGKQIKGTETYAKLSYPHFLTGLEMFTNTWLEKEQDGLFQYEFGWKDKEPITWTETKTSGSNTEEYEYKDPYFTEDYSDEEIEMMISFLKHEQKQEKKTTKNAVLGFVANNIVELIKPVTQNWIVTKLYSFVYDVMLVGKCVGKVITEEGFSGDIGRDKFQQVKNWIVALNSYMKRK